MIIKLINYTFGPSKKIKGSVAKRQATTLALLSLVTLLVIAIVNLFFSMSNHPVNLQITSIMTVLIAAAYFLSRTKYAEFATWLYLTAVAIGLYIRAFIVPDLPHISALTFLLYATMLMPLAVLLLSPAKARIIMIFVVATNLLIPMVIERVSDHALGVLESNVKIYTVGMLVYTMIQSWIYREGINDESITSAANTVNDIGRTIVQRLQEPLQATVDLLERLIFNLSENRIGQPNPSAILEQIETHTRLAMIFSKGLQFLNNKDVVLNESVPILDIINSTEKLTNGLADVFTRINENGSTASQWAVRANMDLAISTLTILMVNMSRHKIDNSIDTPFTAEVSKVSETIIVCIRSASSLSLIHI